MAGTSIGLIIGFLFASVLVFALARRGARAILCRRGPQEREAMNVEARAGALMSELCPWGWRAQVTLRVEPSPEVGGGGQAGRVAVDWAELDPDGFVAVERRVWGATIAQALEAMVADRRTDETLEQIERLAELWGPGSS